MEQYTNNIKVKFIFVLLLLQLTDLSAVASGSIEAESYIEAVIKISRKHTKDLITRKGAWKLRNDSTASQVESLLWTHCPEWREERFDTLYTIISPIDFSNIWYLKILTKENTYIVEYNYHQPQSIRVYSTEKRLSLLVDYVKKWDVKMFRFWKKPAEGLHDTPWIRAIRLSKGKKKNTYTYEYYDFNDNSPIYEYIKEKPLRYEIQVI